MDDRFDDQQACHRRLEYSHLVVLHSSMAADADAQRSHAALKQTRSEKQKDNPAAGIT
jgi:hypothetical protein